VGIGEQSEGGVERGGGEVGVRVLERGGSDSLIKEWNVVGPIQEDTLEPSY